MGSRPILHCVTLENLERPGIDRPPLIESANLGGDARIGGQTYRKQRVHDGTLLNEHGQLQLRFGLLVQLL